MKMINSVKMEVENLKVNISTNTKDIAEYKAKMLSSAGENASNAESVTINAHSTGNNANYSLLNGPSDIGGKCPSPTYVYYHQGIDYCCCGHGCCWERCILSKPPAQCLQNVTNSKWIYSKELGYFQAFQFKNDYQLAN